ncbi:MAG TPA: DUF6680 family protein, partial [Paracoccaceae bacterium]|nr:DUF6680 family protein [Paracoccaceae bacterium]
MTMETWVMVAAIVIGPVAAVLLTIWIERKRLGHERRMNVFRDLMRTRKRILDPAHVSAINLVEIEFFWQKDVISSFTNLMHIINEGVGHRNGESGDDYWKRFTEEYARRLTEMLDEMGRTLGYGYKQLEILKGGYNPSMYVDAEERQHKTLRLFADIYDGRRSLPIAVVDRLDAQAA